MIVLYSLALMPLGLVLTFTGVSGFLFGAASLVLGLWFFLLTLKLRRTKTHRNARRVFFASLVYLPLLMLFLVIDQHSSGSSSGASVAAAKPPTPAPVAAIPAGWDQRAQANAGAP
jgi:heme O synthase-like polyprenyltransferase